MARSRILPLLLFALATPVCRAGASAPRFPDIMPLSQVKAGMHGYGLTVFRGTKIDRFEVAIVGVVKKGSLAAPGHDMILVRMFGGPITTRHAYLIRGMSGSPVYVNGKIIGAFSQGEPTTKEALGGVTPIEDMLEAWDPRLPENPQARLTPDTGIRTTELRQPLHVGDRTIRRVVYNVPLKSGLRSHGDTLVMHACTTFATFNSPSVSAREKLAKALEPFNVELVKGAATGADPSFKGAPLVPGAAFAMMLLTGDLSLGATGTVTYRRNNRILGFGHRFMNIGPIDAPLASSYTYDVYPLIDGSYKISSFGPVVGASAQDTMFAVSGYIGKQPQTIPITVDVRDKTTGRAHVFHAQSVTHPNLFAAIVSSTVGAAISEIRSTPGPTMATVTTTVDADEVGKVTRSNFVYDSRGIDGAATADLDDFLSILTSNPFYPLGLKSANVRVEIESGRKTAQVERVFLKEGKFEPGETAQIGIVIKPYKQPAVTRIIPLKLPQNTPSGRYVLLVKGGAVPPGINFGGIVLRPPPSQSSEQAPPASVRQMVARYEEKEKQNEVVARLALLSTSVNVDGERLSNLPPSLDALMRSSKTSGVRLERDEIKLVEPTDWVISGQQMIAVTVQRKDNQETASPSASSPGVPSSTSAPAFVQTSGGADADLSTVSPSPLPSDPDADTVFAHRSSPLDVDDQKPGRDEGKKPNKRDTRKGGKPAPSPAAAKETTPPAEEPKPSGEPRAAASDQPTTEKPVGRQPLVWRQTSRTDFAKGEAHGLAVTSAGDLMLTRSIKPFFSSTESFVWSLIPDHKGGLIVGTGTDGALLRVGPDGKAATVANLPEVSIHGLVLQPDGSIIAGTGPHGRIYRVHPDGKFEVMFEAPEKYILALAKDSGGRIYAATGGGAGRIYCIDPNGKSREFFKTGEDHVLSLDVAKDGTVYAGTSPNGIIYRIAPDGKASVLYDATEASITGIGTNSKGDVYAATAPRGAIYKIDANGASKVLFDKAPGAFTALRVGPDDTVFASSGSAVYIIRPGDDTVCLADNKADVDILALATDGARLYAGTGNVAEIYYADPLGGKTEGVYRSVIHDAKQLSRWGTIRWTASVPTDARLSIRTRSGNVSEPDSSWSGWDAPSLASDGARITSPAGRYIQYQVTMDGVGTAGPALRDVAITYLPRNQAPKVAFQSPAGGERWAGKQTLKWDASDPDKDTLSYEVYYSPDAGVHWLPLQTEGKPGAPIAETPKAAAPPVATNPDNEKVPLGSGPPSVSTVKAELDKHPDLPAAIRDAILARAEKVNADYGRGQGTGAGPGGASAIGQREATRAFSTKLLPDGIYQFKVVASDRISNPEEPLTAESISEPVVICNATPSVMLYKDAVTVHDGAVTIAGSVVQSRISVTGVQYRVDGGDWAAASSRDGIFDTGSETFTVACGRLSPGKHTIEVKAFNSAGLTASDKLEIEVK